MASSDRPRAARDDLDGRPLDDPWQAFSYVVAGVLLYGGLGYLADRWLDTSFLVVVGILLGAALGMWMVWRRFGHHDPTPGDREHDGRS